MTKQYAQRDPAITSRIMLSIRSSENRVERALRSELFALGLRFRKNVSSMPGKPDIVFPRFRTVVFVDGDFWHGRIYRERGMRALTALFKTPNRSYWTSKILRNVKRDKQVERALGEAGWTFLRFWESDVRTDAQGIAKLIAKHLRVAGKLQSKGRASRK